MIGRSHVTDVDNLVIQELPVYIKTKVAISEKKLGHSSSMCWYNQQQQPIKQRSQRTKNQLKPTHAMQAITGSSSDEEDFDTNQLRTYTQDF